MTSQPVQHTSCRTEDDVVVANMVLHHELQQFLITVVGGEGMKEHMMRNS